jgi:hypothetical protein
MGALSLERGESGWGNHSRRSLTASTALNTIGLGVIQKAALFIERCLALSPSASAAWPNGRGTAHRHGQDVLAADLVVQGVEAIPASAFAFACNALAKKSPGSRRRCDSAKGRRTPRPSSHPPSAPTISSTQDMVPSLKDSCSSLGAPRRVGAAAALNHLAFRNGDAQPLGETRLHRNADDESFLGNFLGAIFSWSTKCFERPET